MKKIFLVGASVFALGMGSAMAGNESEVFQADTSNTATVSQTQAGAAGNDSLVDQGGQRGSVFVEQVGSGNISDAIQQAAARDGIITVNQSGSANTSDVIQGEVKKIGVHASRAEVDQTGDSNEALIRQGTASTFERYNGTIEQVGNTNLATIYQSATVGGAGRMTSSRASIFQNGNGNEAVTEQYPTGSIGNGLGSGNNSDTQQLGDGSYASVSQAGGGNSSTVQQDVVAGGVGHFAQVTQIGNGHDSMVSQIGSGHSVTVTQN